ncbi:MULTISPECIES: histidine phosphatase family protein [Actinosynnema]|uniref:histidine phosphatase family protein n=1 Tax=Actinosynnema TaxID=40566 RepID=UPI0020A2F5B0|nr:histidine phosphatase family protein [Actinosynnema pretiosum]MCP2092126.1 Broad specificity phosphatase PhoE [Actinosynnema pretiosum]
MHLNLLRHGADTRRGERSLTVDGRRQAALAGAWLRRAHVTEVRTGALARASATAGIVAGVLGVPAVVDRRLDEIAATSAPPPRERRPGAEVAGEECWGAFLERVAALVSELCAEPAPGRRVVLVTHSGVFDAVHELLTGARRVELAVAHTGITHWEHRPGSPAGTWLLHRHNATPHLDAAAHPAGRPPEHLGTAEPPAEALQLVAETEALQPIPDEWRAVR